LLTSTSELQQRNRNYINRSNDTAVYSSSQTASARNCLYKNNVSKLR